MLTYNHLPLIGKDLRRVFKRTKTTIASGVTLKESDPTEGKYSTESRPRAVAHAGYNPKITIKQIEKLTNLNDYPHWPEHPSAQHQTQPTNDTGRNTHRPNNEPNRLTTPKPRIL